LGRDRPQRAGITATLAHHAHKEFTPWVAGGIMGVLPPRKVLPPSFEEWHIVEFQPRGALCLVTIDYIVLQDLDLARIPAPGNISVEDRTTVGPTSSTLPPKTRSSPGACAAKTASGASITPSSRA
jgi:hypothetical protein